MKMTSDFRIRHPAQGRTGTEAGSARPAPASCDFDIIADYPGGRTIVAATSPVDSQITAHPIH